MHELIVTAVGRDRPGIVVAVTKVLFDLGCNLSDCSMTRLSSQFAMILLVEAPDEAAKERLKGALEAPATDLGLTVEVVESPVAPVAQPLSPYVVSLYGADRPGIVYRVANVLSKKGVNITDLVSHPMGQGVYTVLLEVDLPATVEAPEVTSALKEVAAELGVDFSLRASESAEL